MNVFPVKKRKQHLNEGAVGSLLMLLPRIGAMLLIAPAVMLILYPVLHELGHAAAAVCTGAHLKEIAVFPLAHTDMRFDQLSRPRLLATAFAGSVFPLIVLALPDFRRYILYYIKLTIAVITAVESLTFLPGTPSDIGYVDDAALVTAYYPDLEGIVWVIAVLIFAGALSFCLLSHPLARTIAFLSGDFRPVSFKTADRYRLSGSPWERVVGKDG